jgi:hypothetical protein
MNSKKVIATNKLTERHLKAICELLGIVLVGSANFGELVQIYFNDEIIKDENKCLMIRETGEIFIFFDSLVKNDQAVNTVSLVFYLKEHGLLFEQY